MWIQRINAATREHGLTYSRFISGLAAAGIEVDRKVLSDLAITEPAAFAAIVEQAKGALPKGRLKPQSPSPPGMRGGLARAGPVPVETGEDKRPGRELRNVGPFRP